MPITAPIAYINGPNLNLLGTREPEIYGSETLADVEAKVARLASKLGVAVSFFQSNSEGAICDHIHQLAAEGATQVVINAGAYTHTSVAIADALAGTGMRWIEVHISNVYAREAFRHHSTLSAGAAGVIVGVGTLGYELALRACVDAG